MAENVGTLIFHHQDGVDVFALQVATVKVIQHPREIELLFYVCGEGSEDCQRTLTNAEVSVFVSSFDPTSFVGRRFNVPRSYDEERADHVSCFYHHEHRDLNRNVIEVLNWDGERFSVRWTGTSNDEDSHEDEPIGQVVIDAKFLTLAAART